MNPVGHQHCLILRLHHFHGSVRPQQIYQQAIVVGIEVLNQDKGHAGIGGHMIEETSKRGEPTGRRPNAHYERGRTSSREICFIASNVRWILFHVFLGRGREFARRKPQWILSP
ncbi:hypothetical protein ABIG04_002246 [Bradyrhizobium japonicum]